MGTPSERRMQVTRIDNRSTLVQAERTDPPMQPIAKDQVSSSEPWTVGRVLQWVTQDFRARNLESPRLEAEVLLAHSLRCDRITLLLERDRPLMPQELSNYRALVARRRNHEPTAYLLGQREFFGYVFQSDPRALIPRPDTETLVETAIKLTEAANLHGTALDLCTGSGIVAIAFAKHRPTWRVDGVDISKEALCLARQNAVRLGGLWGIRFLSGDLFEALPKDACYDIITANPPYIPTEEWSNLEAHIREHEPRLALDGGSDGLDVIRRIIAHAPAFLREEGALALEIAFNQANEVSALFDAGHWQSPTVVQDLGGRDRVVWARLRTAANSCIQRD